MDDSPKPQSVEEPRMLEAYLRGRDVPCPSCGYNLRDLPNARCPECGRDLVLQLAAAPRPPGVFIVSIIGLALGAGFSGLLIVYQIVQALRGRTIGLWIFILLTVGGTVVEGALVVWLMMVGQRFVTWPRRWQMLCAVCCWLLSLANGLAFAFLVP